MSASARRADFRLKDPGVSREHVRFTLGPTGVRVRDNNSKNGTYLGGARIHEVTFTADTAIQVGATTLGISVRDRGHWSFRSR